MQLLRLVYILRIEEREWEACHWFFANDIISWRNTRTSVLYGYNCNTRALIMNRS